MHVISNSARKRTVWTNLKYKTLTYSKDPSSYIQGEQRQTHLSTCILFIPPSVTTPNIDVCVTVHHFTNTM